MKKLGKKSRTLTLTPSSKKSDQLGPKDIELAATTELFNQFIGADKVRNFKIDKVVIVENPTLETAFFSKYEEFRSESIEAPWSNQPGDLEWKKWIIKNFSKYVRNMTGEETANLVLGWHGGGRRYVHRG